jgi:hypothetical protein
MTETNSDSAEVGIEFYYKLELGGLPEEEFEIPAEVLEDDADFTEDEGKIAEFYKALLYEFGNDEFNHLISAKLDFLWKAKGGKSGGRDVLGKCKKPSGELRHYSGFDYIILFSADHCARRRLKNWQILALLYHELKHTAMDENGKFVVRGHDFEGFMNELKIFGAWKSDAEAIIRTAQNLPLFDK